jgi:hypothetical protein
MGILVYFHSHTAHLSSHSWVEMLRKANQRGATRGGPHAGFVLAGTGVEVLELSLVAYSTFSLAEMKGGPLAETRSAGGDSP